ncbi:MAG: hypothetical protein ACFFCI_07935 [Promethearchaeota archaeon]
MGVIVLLGIKTVFYRFPIPMDDNYYCPRCKSSDVEDWGEIIYCPHCDLEFDKEFFGEVDDEDILSREELSAFTKVFEDEFRDNSDFFEEDEEEEDDEYEF